ncbi:hypothetical protein [Rhizomonospora bruguierae]|uniref:hypothetical protein n=1 Tax=Rhizomonospora bruguierae TaxID=1581705 RepID=UPI001BCC7668|nr:hypothetical protein [Micromonospora sp. NBRC 107566]
MRDQRTMSRIGEHTALPMLALLSVLVIVLAAGRSIGLCIVFRLARRAIPGCVPAWSADRAPPAPSAA